MGVLITTALLSWVHMRAPIFGEVEAQNGQGGSQPLPDAQGFLSCRPYIV